MMDLFNLPIIPNYKVMKHKLDVSKIENPYIQVVWEDIPENFTQERVKSVRAYFAKKYNSLNVNVLTKVKMDKEVQQTVDVSINIMDRNYQVELLKELLKQKGQESMIDSVLELDGVVESKLQSEEHTSFKKWYIKKIEFSNFLSYGENQVLDFEKCNGITVVESNPPNFGGKTVLTVDLLMFLFFNTTTKSAKAEEVFNRFTDKDTVSVRGEVTIDGEDYIIARQLTRKLSKSGEWNVKTVLDFFKRLPDGQLQNFTGEQRRETEAFIKNSIGDMDDFLMTILTTASNLEDLIESKPTARGQVLSRFLGLEFLKRKEEIGKEVYSTFNKSMLSNVYNTETLKTEINGLESKIDEYRLNNTNLEEQIVDAESRLEVGKKFREDLLSQKYNDIDHDLIVMNPKTIESEISLINEKIVDIKSKIKNTNVQEPSDYYHEDQHDDIKEQYKSVLTEVATVKVKISDIESLKSSVSGGIKCEHCGIELMNAAITTSKIAELDGLIMHKEQKEGLMRDLTIKEQSYVKLKKEFDEYEKNKLIKEKYELTLESETLKLEKNNDKLKRYFEVKEKIEKNKQIEEKILKAEMRIEEIQREKTSHASKISSNNTMISNFKKDIETKYGQISQIAQEFEKEKVYKIYLDIFGKNGISKMIMKTMMPLINEELQRLLQDSALFKLEVRINDKNEVEFMMIDNSTNIEKPITTGSGFERTIASLALRAVLSKICSLPKPNIVVFDEVFGKISNDNLEMVGEFFTKIKDYFEKIFVITHNPLVGQWANSVVKIEKTNNISKVVQ
jgi:DNA repair exonuclease SbcCD ATPase subunit